MNFKCPRWPALLCAGILASSCDDKPSTPLAPTARALAPSTATPSAGSLLFQVEKASSEVGFVMDAPQEKIRGRVVRATEGELRVDPADVTRTTGLLTVDMGELELFQRKEQDGVFGEESKSDTQNAHARQWLEIGEDAPAAEREANRKAQFAIRSIEGASAKSVAAMTGAERKLTLAARGDFLLHGRTTSRVARLEVTFHYEGDRPVRVSVKSVSPFAVGLAEHDVRPREAFGKIAQKTLEMMSPKVAKEALISIELTARLSPDAAPAQPAGAAPEKAAPGGY